MDYYNLGKMELGPKVYLQSQKASSRVSSGAMVSSDMSAVKVSGQPGLRLEVERNMNMVMYAAYCGFIVGAVIFFSVPTK